MIVAVLTHSLSCYTVRQLVEVGQLLGHEVALLDCRSCLEKSFDVQPRCETAVDSFEEFEAIFAWLVPRDLEHGLCVMREHETTGRYSPNTSAAITRACDRLWLAQTLVQENIPVPHAVVARSSEDISSALDRVGEGPWILKRLCSPGSFDRIVGAETREAALIALDGFRKVDREIVVQRFIAEANCEDVRVLVVGYQAIGAILRRAQGSDVLPSWSSPALRVSLTLQERRVAEEAANALDLAIADITLIRSNQGPLMLDVNPFPQLQWWDQHASEPAAYRIFRLIESRDAAH
jgi:ribosomal protein S6--L-glutamate ligase